MTRWKADSLKNSSQFTVRSSQFAFQIGSFHWCNPRAMVLLAGE
jgi:hypothetical protein